jgi:hypothetical protein
VIAVIADIGRRSAPYLTRDPQQLDCFTSNQMTAMTRDDGDLSGKGTFGVTCLSLAL